MAQPSWLRSLLPDEVQDRATVDAAVPRRPQLFVNGRFLVQQATGVQRVAVEIVRGIDTMLDRSELVADVTLLVPRGEWVQPLNLRHIAVETVGTRRGVWWEQLDLPRRATGGTLLCLGNSAPALTLLAGWSRVAVMIHDVSFLDHPAAYRLSYRMAHRRMLPLLMRAARHIVTVSQTERERLVRLSPAAAPRITVAPNGGWSGGGSAGADALPEIAEPYGLYVGSLSRRKNFERTLAAAVRLAREDDLDFVFVGASGGILQKPRCEVPADVAHRIHFLGQINDSARLAGIYRNARLLLFPSLYEACPLPPLEAAHFGCPVVVSNIPSMWERCGRAALYCDPMSVDSIVRAARTALAQGPERDALVAAGQAMSGRRSWEAQAQAICARILGESRATLSSPPPRWGRDTQA
ncbi:glycosyltransferase family 4 protein [Novosphingobium kaempferiae]|uniref:glycosyltransferase family 4 protein n=1 Tax=Novosphingobium kaempferiae TaxID=2896849 RepID=UPI001E56FF79|nr:glycosyltransferase family 1 protein [Novosphingobium kaempferiae]